MPSTIYLGALLYTRHSKGYTSVVDLNTVPHIEFGSGSRILANWDPVIIQGYVIYFENKKLQKNLEKNYLLF